jgi:hypothetical protein
VFQRQVLAQQKDTFSKKLDPAESSRLPNETQKTVMRDVFRFFNFAEQPVGKTKDRLPVSVVQLQKGRLVTLSCSCQ